MKKQEVVLTNEQLLKVATLKQVLEVSVFNELDVAIVYPEVVALFSLDQVEDYEHTGFNIYDTETEGHDFGYGYPSWTRVFGYHLILPIVNRVRCEYSAYKYRRLIKKYGFNQEIPTFGEVCIAIQEELMSHVSDDIDAFHEYFDDLLEPTELPFDICYINPETGDEFTQAEMHKIEKVAKLVEQSSGPDAVYAIFEQYSLSEKETYEVCKRIK